MQFCVYAINLNSTAKEPNFLVQINFTSNLFTNFPLRLVTKCFNFLAPTLALCVFFCISKLIFAVNPNTSDKQVSSGSIGIICRG